MKFVLIALAVIPLALSMALFGRQLAREGSWPIRRHSETIGSWQRRLKTRLLGQRVALVGGLVGLGLAILVVLLLQTGAAGAQQVRLKANLQVPVSNPFYGVSLVGFKEE